MNINDRVEIVNTNNVWEGKKGVIEDIQGNIATVFVDFDTENNKRVRQDFDLDNLIIDEDYVSDFITSDLT